MKKALEEAFSKGRFSSASKSLPLKGKPLFCKSALIHRHAMVIRALQANKNLPKRNCFPEGSNPFHSDKPEFIDVSKCLSYIVFHYVFCILPAFLLLYNLSVF